MIEKRNKLIMFVMVAVSAAIMGGTAWAVNPVTYAADAAPMCQVLNGYTGTLTIAISGSGGASDVMTEVVTCDGNATTRVFTNGADTVATVETWIAGCTNAAGKKLLTVNAEPSLAADTSAPLAGTYTAKTGKYLTIPWDTSASKHYDIYLPSTVYGGAGAYRLGKVVGQPTGTGNVTYSVYQNGTLIDQSVITSPVYVPSAGLEATNNFTAIDIVNLSQPEGITFLGTQPIIIRAARATTATTGFISAIIEDASAISR